MGKRAKLLTCLSLIAVFLAVGFVSYQSAWHKANKDKNVLRTQISRLKNDLVDSTYIELKPWGVEFPLADNSAQLIYIIGNDGIFFDSEGLEVLAFSRDPKNRCLPNSASLGALSQSPNPVKGTASIKSNGVVAHVGSYYYNYFHPAGGCSSDKTVVDEQMKQAANLITALRGLRPVK